MFLHISFTARCCWHIRSFVLFTILNENILDGLAPESRCNKLVPIYVFDLLHHLFERDRFLRKQIALWLSDFHSFIEVLGSYFGSNLIILSFVDKILYVRRLETIFGSLRHFLLPKFKK